MKVKVKLDKLSLSTPKKTLEMNHPLKIADYKFDKIVKRQEEIEDIRDFNVCKYEYIRKYKNPRSTLIVCTQRKKGFNKISPMYLIFYTRYYSKITYSDVKKVEVFFKDLNVPLRVSIIHIALDIITERIEAYNNVIMSLKPGAKRKPSRIYESETEDGMYFGEFGSRNHLLVYDKTKQMSHVKGINIERYVCRIELRMRMHQMQNFIRTIDELADHDWSFIYDKFYSFHYRKDKLKKQIKAVGEEWRKPIWELRNIMEDEYGIYPSNFYRDYLIPHPKLSYMAKEALKNYKWGKET